MSDLAALLADLRGADIPRAEAAATALPALGEAALEVLRPLLQDTNTDTRWWAVRCLAGFAQPQAGQHLAAALADADPAVQHCAALALSQRPHPYAIPSLLAHLASTDSLLARLCGDALAAQGAPAVEPLMGLLNSAPLSARIEAARALALIGDTRAVPALFAQLDSDSAMLEHWVSAGLEKMGIGMTFFRAG